MKRTHPPVSWSKRPPSGLLPPPPPGSLLRSTSSCSGSKCAVCSSGLWSEPESSPPPRSQADTRIPPCCRPLTHTRTHTHWQPNTPQTKLYFHFRFFTKSKNSGAWLTVYSDTRNLTVQTRFFNQSFLTFRIILLFWDETQILFKAFCNVWNHKHAERKPSKEMHEYIYR